LFVTLAALLGAGDGRDGGDRPTSDAIDRRVLPMMFDPELPQAAPEIQFDRRNIAIWFAALQRPEFDIRVEAIEAFAAAHRQGVKDLNEAVPPIEKLLSSDPNPDVRLAAAKALIEFDHKPAAAALQHAVSDDSNASSELLLTVDAALARWQHADAIPMWIARLKQCATHPTAGISAIRSLASVRAKESGDALAACVRDRTLSPAVRLEASTALPLVDAAGRSKLAAELAAEPGLQSWGPLFALLAVGSGQNSSISPALDIEAIALVESLASNPDARVRSHALSLLRRADNSRAMARMELLRDLDDQVRLEAIRALVAAPLAESVTAPLASALNDVSEPVRVAARVGLRDRSKLDSSGVQDAIERALTGGRWREAEQAAILAGELTVAAAADRLEVLLAFERTEVRLAAAIALRQLDRNESLPALFARAETLTAAVHESAKVPERFDSEGAELVQIFMAFAQQHHAAAVPLLKKYIPKRSGFHPLARGAAIYALGKIFENQPTPELAARLLERAEDNNPIDPEAADVRRFSLVALGRMRSRETLQPLRGIYEDENSVVTAGGAARWAIMHIESVELPPCKPVVKKSGPFFLESISPDPTPAQP
jgi:HEAT repeat protein